MDTTSHRFSESELPHPSLPASTGGPPRPSAPTREQELHVADYLRVVLARKWFLIAFFLLTVGVVSAHTYAQTPIYQASALILIEPKQINIANVEELYDPTGGAGQREYYTTQYQLLASRRIAEPVHEQLKLARSTTLRQFMEQIVVDPQRNSRLVRVGYRSADPQEAAKVANALVESYVLDNQQRSLGINTAGLNQLRERAKELRAKIEQAAGEIDRFKTERNVPLFARPEEYFGSRLEVLNAQLSDARSKRVWAEAELSTIDLRPLETSPELNALRAQLSELEQERASLALAFKPKHPRIQALDAGLAALRARQEVLQAQAREALRAGTQAHVEALRAVEEGILAEAEVQTRSMIEAGRDSSALKMLTQNHEAVLQSYLQVIARIEEVDLAAKAGSKDRNVFEIERAEVPTVPVEPNVTRNLGLALFVGLLGGLGLCFLIDYLDRSIKGREDVERRLGATVLGHVPAAVGDDALVVSARPPSHSPMAEAFRAIRTAVTFGSWNGASAGPRALMITSALSGDGKSLVSANLAVALAQLGKRVVLIDCDLRNPNVHRVFKLEGRQERGLSTLLAEGHALDDVLRSPAELPNLSLLPAGPKPPNPADLLNGEAMAELLGACAERFDWVLLDTPPASVADPMILSTYVRNVLLVVRTYTTPWDLAQRATQELTALGSRLFGVVLNDVDLPSHAHYGYSYGAGYGYGASYGAKRGRAAEPLESDA